MGVTSVLPLASSPLLPIMKSSCVWSTGQTLKAVPC